MSKPFDSTVKTLLEADLDAWLRLLLGTNTAGPARIINADLSTITAEADTVVRVEANTPWLLHVEFQTGHDRSLPDRLQRYNVLVRSRHGLPVWSVAVLLRKEADGPALTGLLQHHLPDGRRYHEFRYDVVRVWDLPVDRVLAAGLGTLPLAPLCRDAAADLPAVVHRIARRLSHVARPIAADLAASTYLLMGLRYPGSLVESFREVLNAMEDSVTYQAILDRGKAEGRTEGRAEGRAEGEAREARKLLLRFGTHRFGTPDEATRSAIDAIADRDRLESLCERVYQVHGWNELFEGD